MSALSRTFAAALASSLALAAALPARAAPVYVMVGKDLSTGSYDVTFAGGTITFSNGDDFPNYFRVETKDGAEVRTVFGGPSTDFTDRGYPFYDTSTLGGYASYPTPTIVGYSNGNSFLGLRVQSGSDYFYGFAFTTNNVLNSFGYETTANTGILGVTAPPAAAVPEPATWALMIAGFGAVGGAMRRRRAIPAAA